MLESRILKELHHRIFELTLALYRVTDFFPQNEILRKNVREKANEIFGCITEYGYIKIGEREITAIAARIQAIKGYLDIAEMLRFIKPINVLVLKREYDFLADFFMREISETEEERMGEREDIRQGIKKEAEKGPLRTWQEFSEKSLPETEKRTEKEEEKLLENMVISSAKNVVMGNMNERQKAIMEYIKRTPRVKVSDFFTFFQGVSVKTIQRDLHDLVARNILKREGEKRWTIYSKI